MGMLSTAIIFWKSCLPKNSDSPVKFCFLSIDEQEGLCDWTFVPKIMSSLWDCLWQLYNYEAYGMCMIMINYGSARGSNLSSASLLIFFFRICDCTWLFIVWTLYSVKTSMKLCCILTYYSQIVILCAALTHHWKKVPSSFLSHFCNSIIFKLNCDSFIIMDL